MVVVTGIIGNYCAFSITDTSLTARTLSCTKLTPQLGDQSLADWPDRGKFLQWTQAYGGSERPRGSKQLLAEAAFIVRPYILRQ